MPLKIKFLLITSVLLVGSAATIFLINRQSFLADKKTYLYSTAMERVENQSQQFQKDFDVSFERIRTALLLFDPATQQFPPQVKALAQKQNWGRISLFYQDPGFPLRRVDSLGEPVSLSPADEQLLTSLADQKVVIQNDFDKSDSLRVLFHQGNYFVFADLNFAYFSRLKEQDEMGILQKQGSKLLLPKHLQALQPSAEILSALILENQNGVKEIQLNSQTYLVSFKKLPELDVFVFEVFNKKSIYAVLDSILNRTLFASAIILVLGLIAMFFSVDSLTSNLSRLAEAMKSFSSNGVAKKLNIASQDEVGQMAGVFNSMQGKIENLLVLSQEKARMAAELETAKLVQNTLLPKPKVSHDQYVVKGFYQPASECGGDLWFYHCHENKILLFVGDATGHGVSAALITAATRSILSFIVEENIWSPSRMLSMINKVLCDIARGEKMMTAFACVVDIEQRSVTYSNASHDIPFLLPLAIDGQKVKKTDLQFLTEVNGKRLGHERDAEYKEKTMAFLPGQTLMIYTDGLVDAVNGKAEVFGERKIIKQATDSSSRSSQQNYHDQIAKQATAHTEGVEQPDDITFVSFHMRTT